MRRLFEENFDGKNFEEDLCLGNSPLDSIFDYENYLSEDEESRSSKMKDRYQIEEFNFGGDQYNQTA